MLMFQYLDDWLNLAQDRALAAIQTLLFVEICVNLGLVVNLEKSELEPSQRIMFFGFEFDFTVGLLFPLKEKQQNVERVAGKCS